jgi:hypothetical protein
MATKALQPLRLDKCAAGNSPEFVQLTTSGTLVAGDLLIKANGAASICSDEPQQISYLTVCADTDIIPGSNTGVINVLAVKPHDTFEISAVHSTAASAVVADSAVDAKAEYGVKKATVSGVIAWGLDLQDTTNTSVRLIERVDSATDLYPRVRVQFLSTVCTPYGA